MFTIHENAPVRFRVASGFVTRTSGGCGFDSWEEPVFDHDARDRGSKIRETRTRAGLYLNDCARLFGITVAEFSALERGAKSVEPFDEAIALIESRARRRA